MTGSSVFDYIHPGDHSEVLEQLGLRTPTPGPPTPPSVSSSSSSSSSSLADTAEIEASLTKVPPSSLVQERSFFVRMKSTLTKRGLHVKASGYKVIHVTGRLRAHALGLVALGHTLPPAPLAELPLHGHMIVFRLSLGLTILACESRVSDHMDLGPSELVGRSCYQFVHGQDATRIRQSHVDSRRGLRVAAIRGHSGWEREEPRGAPCALGQPRAQPSRGWPNSFGCLPASSQSGL
ncbi:PREDICTED: neuronal PAS domain-containing protein 1 isoform X5 [Rhinopithecus bieti]|nr:PREDICTED: neuronal PAS domain-containing protein 1 isoform X5 [Rhinopithecus bieti]